LPPLNLGLLQILFNIFHPSQSWSSLSSSSPQFILKYFLNDPLIIHSCYIFSPFQSILLITATMSKSLYCSLNSWLVIILHVPCSNIGPLILLNIFLSHPFSRSTSIPVIRLVLLPYTTAGFTLLKNE
jgi:hypothetical protein